MMHLCLFKLCWRSDHEPYNSSHWHGLLLCPSWTERQTRNNWKAMCRYTIHKLISRVVCWNIVYNLRSLIAVSYEARAVGVSRQINGDTAKKICRELVLFQVPVRRGKADLTKYVNCVRLSGLGIGLLVLRLSSPYQNSRPKLSVQALMKLMLI